MPFIGPSGCKTHMLSVYMKIAAYSFSVRGAFDAGAYYF